MKIGTGTKVSIVIIGIIAAGIIGVMIWGIESDKVQISAARKQDVAGTEKGAADAPEKALSASASQQSKEQVVMSKDEEEGWNALMEVLDGVDEIAETSDIKTIAGQSEAPQTTSYDIEDSETEQDQPEMEYHESYNTFISMTRNITQVKAEMDRVREEVERMYGEWKRSVRDPKNPTAEEKAELAEIGSIKEESGELWSDYNSLASELVSEVSAVAPGAIQTESRDYAPKGTMTYVRVNYAQVQSELGSAGPRIDGYLSEFFADFQLESWQGNK